LALKAGEVIRTRDLAMAAELEGDDDAMDDLHGQLKTSLGADRNIAIPFEPEHAVASSSDAIGRGRLLAQSRGGGGVVVVVVGRSRRRPVEASTHEIRLRVDQTDRQQGWR
jgi:hypothetical protein